MGTGEQAPVWQQLIEPEDKPKENPEEESQDSQSLFTIRLYPKLPLRPYYCRVKVLNASRRLFVCDLGYSYSSLDNPIKEDFIRLICNPFGDPKCQCTIDIVNGEPIRHGHHSGHRTSFSTNFHGAEYVEVVEWDNKDALAVVRSA